MTRLQEHGIGRMMWLLEDGNGNMMMQLQEPESSNRRMMRK